MNWRVWISNPSATFPLSINENEGLAEGLKGFCGFKNAYIRGDKLPCPLRTHAWGNSRIHRGFNERSTCCSISMMRAKAANAPANHVCHNRSSNRVDESVEATIIYRFGCPPLSRYAIVSFDILGWFSDMSDTFFFLFSLFTLCLFYFFAKCLW